MKALFALLPVTLFAMASCGSGETKPPPGGEGDPVSSAGGGPVKTCRPTCTTAADCAVPGAALQDAAHFACTAGRCEWRGCQSAAECQSALQSTAVTCATAPGAEIPSCVKTCSAAADCAISGNQLTDASHFACTSGKCTWLGCKSTVDCQSALQTQRITCDKAEAATTPTCQPTCMTPADCAVPGTKLNDASHFACKSNKCVWLGCKSTVECAADLHLANVVCE